MAEQPHLGADMKKEIEKKCEEKEKIAEGKKEFDAKKPNLFKEIEAKSKEHEKVVEGKKEFDAKKPELFKEIKEKLGEK